jgi:hypothetical protein
MQSAGHWLGVSAAHPAKREVAVLMLCWNSRVAV